MLPIVYIRVLNYRDYRVRVYSINPIKIYNTNTYRRKSFMATSASSRKRCEVEMDEGRLERRLKREVEKRGGKALKFICPGMAGVPDRLVLVPGGLAVFVEMKATGKQLRPLQMKRKEDLQHLGFKVYAIDTEQAIDGFIQEVFG